MKATKKIIPALVMLLVSAVLLSTASYAWFSMNTTVTATGMQVTVKAPTSLLISNTSATAGFGSTVNLSNDIKDASSTFAPVAYADVPSVGTYTDDKTTSDSWYKLTSDAMAFVNEQGRVVITGFDELDDGSPADSFTSEKFGEGEDAKNIYEAAGTHIFHDQVWLKIEGEESKDITATLAYTSEPSDTIKNAMHVVFVIDGAIKATVDMGTPGSLTTGVLASLIANEPEGTLVDIYYFLSGNDPDCKNMNISADATMSIDITFNVG